MPRFYFNIRTLDRSIIPDGIGIDFPDLAAAEKDAQDGVSSTFAEKCAAGDPIAFTAVEIFDERGNLLSVVDFPKPRSCSA
jgi:hypothetical protein